MKCCKCGSLPKESDQFAWRCNSCKKVYRVSLKNIQGFAEKKQDGITEPLLKCKECGVPLDDGEETIAWKCSCGNVQKGRLGDFLNVEKDEITVAENAPDIIHPNLVRCPDCGRENVSKSAESCPSCGYGVKAHFDRIKLEEQRLEREKQLQIKREEEKIAKEKQEKERYDSIKMPPKPKTPILSTIIFIALWGLILRWAVFANDIGIFLAFGFFLAFPTGIWIYIVYIAYSHYNLALTDFEAYKRKRIKDEDEYERSKKIQAEMEIYRQMNAPKCPLCGSINIEKISTTSRVVSIATVGLASGKIGKQYKCKKCKHMW